MFFHLCSVFFLPPVVSWLFYTMKFDMAEDRDKVIGESLWMIFDHYLTVAKWSLEFVSSTAKIEKTMVWVRFPGMSLIYYDDRKRSSGASFCHWHPNQSRSTHTRYKVAYEGLHLICSGCGCYGHVTHNFTTTAAMKTIVGTPIVDSVQVTQNTAASAMVQ